MTRRESEEIIARAQETPLKQSSRASTDAMADAQSQTSASNIREGGAHGFARGLSENNDTLGASSMELGSVGTLSVCDGLAGRPRGEV